MKSQAKSELPEDIKVEALTESQWRDLKDLKNWIYRQRVKRRKEKAHGERRTTKEEANEELKANEKNYRIKLTGLT